jgi:hypothetical protein
MASTFVATSEDSPNSVAGLRTLSPEDERAAVAAEKMAVLVVEGAGAQRRVSAANNAAAAINTAVSATTDRANNAAAAAAPALTFREKSQAKTRAKREASAEAAAAAKAGLQLARQQTKAAKTVRDAPLAAHHREHADNGHAHEGGRLGGVLARMLEAPDAEAKVRAARAGRPVLRASVAQSEWASMDEALYATCARQFTADEQRATRAKQGKSPSAARAVFPGAAVLSLFLRGAHPDNFRSRVGHRTALHAAAAQGKLVETRLLLAAGARVEARAGKGEVVSAAVAVAAAVAAGGNQLSTKRRGGGAGGAVDGWTALRFAEKGRNGEWQAVARVLRAHGAQRTW